MHTPSLPALCAPTSEQLKCCTFFQTKHFYSFWSLIYRLIVSLIVTSLLSKLKKSRWTLFARFTIIEKRKGGRPAYWKNLFSADCLTIYFVCWFHECFLFFCGCLQLRIDFETGFFLEKNVWLFSLVWVHGWSSWGPWWQLWFTMFS